MGGEVREGGDGGRIKRGVMGREVREGGDGGRSKREG